MRITRRSWDGRDAAALAAELRALQPPLTGVATEVAAIIEEVERDGDDAVLRLGERFDGVAPTGLRVPDHELRSAAESIPGELAEALETAARNVRAAAEADLDGGPTSVALAQGQRIDLRDVPFESVGAYVPGALPAYPSSVVMCCVPARVAGVDRVAVASPPASDGWPSPAVRAACSIAGVDELYAMGGAQAIAALVLGTESVKPVDFVSGPGNRFVQEAKRQLTGRVGIDGIAGPTELMVVLDSTAEARWVALDLMAQAEHGSEGLLVATSPDAGLLDRVQSLVAERIAHRDSVARAPLALVELPELELAVALADALAPEHLELACEGAEELAVAVRFAGCVFTGAEGGTAFGDYIAGSNHVLPTGGAGRFTGPLGPRTYRRRIATVRIGAAAAAELAPAAATLARAEGFPVHAESAEARSPAAGRGRRS
jgi:histidinol dehydrogenase